MLPKQDLFVQSNGLTFHVQRIGRGSPLVMIMGLGAPGEKWKHNYELLGEHFECIVIDNRGAGQSDKPQTESYATDQMADDVLGIMDALNIQSAHVMGVSMGGAISQTCPSNTSSVIPSENWLPFCHTPSLYRDPTILKY